MVVCYTNKYRVWGDRRAEFAFFANLYWKLHCEQGTSGSTKSLKDLCIFRDTVQTTDFTVGHQELREQGVVAPAIQL